MVAETISFFSGLAAEAWRKARTADETDLEAAFLLSRLGVQPGQRLLDVPCGDGRLAFALAERSCTVVGVDGSPEMLASAPVQPGVDLRLGDMASLAEFLPDSDLFDGAICAGNAVGYLDRATTVGFFAAIATRLRRNARLVIDTEMIAESVLPNFIDRSWMTVEDILMVVEQNYDVAASRLESVYRFVRGANQQVCRLDIEVFTCGELCATLAAAGFSVVSLESDLDGAPFALGETRLLLTASRK